MSENIVRYKVLGKDSDPTIYYLTGYGSTMEQYRPHTAILVRLGFRVMIFDYAKEILESGDPQTLINSMKYIADVIQEDVSSHKATGIYGVSLGSWLGLNIQHILRLKKGIFNTGGASILNIVWTKPLMATAKANFIKNGETHSSMQEAWEKWEYDTDVSRFGDEKIIVMNSSADETIPFEEAQRNLTAWKDQGKDARFVVSRGLGHTAVIKRNMLRVRQLVKFFKEDV